MKNIHIPFVANNYTNQSMFVIDDDYIDCLNNRLLLLCSTKEGTRIRLPEFGLRAYSMLNEPRTNKSINIIISDIRYKISKYIPEIVIKDIQTVNNPDRSISIVGQWYVPSNVDRIYKFSFLIK